MSSGVGYDRPGLHLPPSGSVKRFNDDFSEARARLGTDPNTDELEATWIATLISASGYRKLNVNLDELPPGPGKDAFTAGMANRSQQIGDTHPKDAPTQWLEEFRPGAGVDMLIVVAADDPDDLDAKCTELHDHITANGCIIVYEELGQTLPDPLRGHEHFGFKDGVSQPAIDGWDDPPAAGEPAALPLGEFVLGYPDAAGQTVDPGDLWNDGSFAVFRRLRQDVFSFRQLKAAGVPNADPALNADQLGAKVVGRWPSGASVELSPDADNGVVSNAFDYDQDGEGFNVPRFAHIRKANPRHEARADLADDPTERHRMLRRGSPYGSPLPSEAMVDDNADRGLHFISVVSDVVRQFEFVQSNWMNNPNFPGGQPATPASPYQPPPQGLPDGPDPVVGEFDPGTSDTLHQPSGQHPFALNNELVTVTAGEYFFVPSISALGRLAAGATASSSPPTS